jgi:16S rRNA (cytosine1402-N4)-methyltransferase
MSHVPVLLCEVTDALNIRAGETYVDATFGRGGYTQAWLALGAKVIGFDRDPEAIAVGEQLQAANSNFKMLRGAFSSMDQQLAPGSVAGVAFDLGVSSPQLDNAARGFSFRADGPLDMRMDPTQGDSAADLVNSLPEGELADLIYEFGEEKQSRRIAKAIVTARAAEPITRTLQLARVIRTVMPSRPHQIDPATRTFQALRIAVNDELGEVTRGLAAAETILQPGGRLVVVTFHSLEDRIAKNFLRPQDNPSRHAPLTTRAADRFILIGKQPVTPSESECTANPRARSAKLRVAAKAGGNI